MPERRMERTDGTETPAVGKNYLLAIGIDNYPQDPLDFAVRDAEAIAKVLQAHYQFEPENCQLLTNEKATCLDIKQCLAKLKNQTGTHKLGEDDSLVVFYAGHGYLEKDMNMGYWLPYDGEKGRIHITNVELVNLLNAMPCRHVLLISDSCFSGTFLMKRPKQRGFDEQVAATPSRWAITSGRDEPVLDESPFADALLAVLAQQPDATLRTGALFEGISAIFKKKEITKQVPLLGSLNNEAGGQFVFHRRPAPPDLAEAAWQAALASLSVKVDEPPTEPPVKTPPQETKNVSPANFTETVNGVSFTMIYVEGGEFMMGSPGRKGILGGLFNKSENNEKPAHRVTLDGYHLGQTQVTQALWRAVMGATDLHDTGYDEYPKDVSWDDAQTFLQKLNQLTGRKYRLPTEAQWEFAARGGIQSRGYKYAGSNNLNEVAWHFRVYPEDIFGPDFSCHPVATKMANELGLYDMSGNIWEWCEDDWHDDYTYAPSDGRAWLDGPRGTRRVLRGGVCSTLSDDCRITSRESGDDSRGMFSESGYRLALSQLNG
jgi:formylglycine-generating enzyme required for sulfatase activity